MATLLLPVEKLSGILLPSFPPVTPPLYLFPIVV